MVKYPSKAMRAEMGTIDFTYKFLFPCRAETSLILNIKSLHTEYLWNNHRNTFGNGAERLFIGGIYMNKKLMVLFMLMFAVSAFAFEKTSPSKACFKKVVNEINKHHALAEGGEAYALREIYNGVFASTLLVGYTDETDPADFLVTVTRTDRSCKIESVVYTNESVNVEEYTEAERIENIFKK